MDGFIAQLPVVSFGLEGLSEMNAKRILGVATAAIAALVVPAAPAGASSNSGVSYASNGDGWANFVADGDDFFLNDTRCNDNGVVWAEMSWYTSGSGWHFRTQASTDSCANTEASLTERHPWGDIPENAYVYVRACGSVSGYSNSGAGSFGVAKDCGSTKSGRG
jgi:hypothetical protein